MPDPDYVADCEINDSQRAKRMDQASRGNKVHPPKETMSEIQTGYLAAAA